MAALRDVVETPVLLDQASPRDAARAGPTAVYQAMQARKK